MKRCDQKRRSGHAASGFSIIEMLVGVLIISFGLLSLITLQARALQVSTTTEDAQRAALLANEMAAQMINANNVNLGAAVVDAWALRAATPASGGLPSGDVDVTVNGSTARIEITWRPPSGSGAGNDVHRYITDVVIPQ